MELTDHAKHKLEIYNLNNETVLDLVKNSKQVYFDNNENSFIRIFKMQQKPFVAVVSIETNNVITIYRTDKVTIQNRVSKSRWTKK